MSGNERTVAWTDLPDGKRVSTVRLTIDHGFDGTPLWFETMVFPPDSYTDLDCARYTTREEAEAGHAAMVAKWLAGGDEDSTQT